MFAKRFLSVVSPRLSLVPRYGLKPAPLKFVARHIATKESQFDDPSFHVLDGDVDRNSQEFVENTKRMTESLTQLHNTIRTIKAGGGAKLNERHVSRGKMLTRDRIDSLIDPGSTLLELSQLAATDFIRKMSLQLE